jgi:hypothetical protein
VWRGLPGPVAALLFLLVGAFVLTHLPLVLLAVLVGVFLLTRRHRWRGC